MKEPLLSICIPTYERPEILKKTLLSIVGQDIDIEAVEVCVCDNSSSDSTEKMIEEFKQPYIRYKHIQPVGAYMNLMYALQMGKGKYLKLINDYTMIEDGAITKIIQFLKENETIKPIVSWTNGKNLNYNGDNLDKFLSTIGINVTWAICFGIWRDSFQKIIKDKQINEMFPHVSLLFEECKKGMPFVVYNDVLFHNQELEKKGGYNIPQVFGTEYGKLLKDLYSSSYISAITVNNHNNRMIKFIAEWKVQCLLYSKKFSFSFDDDRRIIKKEYGWLNMLYYYVFFGLYYIKGLIKKTIKHEN